jgi:hypothetical protein
MFTPARYKAARLVTQIISVTMIIVLSNLTRHPLWPIPSTTSLLPALIFSCQWVILVVVLHSENPRFYHIQEEADYERDTFGQDTNEIDRTDSDADAKILKRRIIDYMFSPLILAVILSIVLLVLYNIYV